ncbi:Protein-methionine-sulfoxide reductase heme-binding subunit MsrQ [Alphaproteobacteria bacterium SO-S41]|nr:Protein-methionine-sulfoxide reductase heme-binding subunit MsrQ [Alphaproteobacteria bacterium SO-S41]
MTTTPARPQPTFLQRTHGFLRRVPTWSVYLALMLPAVSTVVMAFTGGLGADPTRKLEHTLGIWALRILLAGLAVTPLRELTGLSLVRFRRVIGLAGFTYVTLHLLVYAVLDVELDWATMVQDIFKRPYITIGMLAFVLLIPLAVTSTNAMIRRMGPKAWNRLHKLIYAIVILGALHFLLLKKTIQVETLTYLGIAIVLVAYRLLPKRRPKPAVARVASP